MIKFFYFLVLFLTYTACRKSHNADKDINSFNVGLRAMIETLDPATSYDTVSSSIIAQAHETLFEYEYLKRPYVLKPLLAQAMPKIEDNGTTYIIKIKKNIPYHPDPAFNGKTHILKAQDFIIGIKRVAFLKNNAPGWWLFENRIVGLDEFRKQAKSIADIENLAVAGLTAQDDYTLIIKLKNKYPQLIYALAMNFSSPVPAEVLNYYKNNLNDHIVGTGPFYLVENNQGNSLKMKRFTDYRHETYPSTGDRYSNENGLLQAAGKKIPFIEQINFYVMKEEQPRWLNFISGNIDFIEIPKDNFSTSIVAGALSEKLREKGVEIQISPTLTYWWLGFNMKDPLLGKNKNLRMAIASAINFDQFIQMFTHNTGQKANSIYVPGIPGYDPSYQLPYSYNLKRAKQYLAKAGYPNGKGLPILKYDTRQASTSQRQMGEYFQKELKKIGIRISISTNNFPGFLNKARKGDLQFWPGGWAMDYPDAENIVQLLNSANHPPGPNTSNYHNTQFDQLFEQLKYMVDGPEKYAVMRKMENLVWEDVPWVMLYYKRNYILYRNVIRNFRHSALGPNYYKYLKVLNK